MNSDRAQPGVVASTPRNPRRTAARRRICFVTGTRAEFGLMEPALDAIAAHRDIALQIVATGMHLDRSRGGTLRQIKQEGWRVDATVPWSDRRQGADGTAKATGLAMARLADVYQHLQSDIVLVVGDRVEAFAAASAAHIAGRIVAHVHGGDRALGLVDDALRHAITKLAHLHLPATAESARRIEKMGEESWRIHRVGSPGLDGVRELAAPSREVEAYLLSVGAKEHTGLFALLVLHPETADESPGHRQATMLLEAVGQAGFERTVIIYPNNDPGAAGIVRAWRAQGGQERAVFLKNAPRPIYLGLLRDAAALVGNSSSGIIEAATFGTPVLDVGSRQSGRQRSANVVHVPWDRTRIDAALKRTWNNGRPRRSRAKNVYGEGAAGKIADILGRVTLDDRLRRKLIRY